MKKVTFDDMPVLVGDLLEEVHSLRKEVSELKASYSKNTTAENKPNQKEIYSAKQIASYLNMSIHTVYKMVYDGRIPYIKTGNRLQFSRDDIKAWLAERSHEVLAHSKEDVQKAVAAYRKPFGR